LFISFGFGARFWIYSGLTFSLIVASFIDQEFQLIPDSISVGGIFVGLLVSILVPKLHYAITWKDSLIDSILGIVVGGGLIYLTGVLGNIAFKKESMGGGDVKLLAMLGAFLGWKMAILVFFLAPFFGTPAGLYLKFKKKCDIIPYGPYISMAGFAAIILGDKILRLVFI
jgi:leader peptidase (prepilin peptidase)/N-methyltransferase